jgi:hypothetical protein
MIRRTIAVCGIAAAAALGGMACATRAHADTSYADCVASAQASGGNTSGLVAMCCTSARLIGQATGPECNQSNQAPKP